MSKPSSVFNPDLQSTMDKLAGQDALSDATHLTGTNANTNKQKMTSKVLKFSFVYTSSNKQKVAPSVIHTHWMQAVQEAYGTGIIIVNNKNQNVKTVSTLKWTDPSIHAKQFQLHQKTLGRDERRTPTFYVIHCVLTNVSLSKIRSVQRIVQEFNDKHSESVLWPVGSHEYQAIIYAACHVWSRPKQTRLRSPYCSRWKCVVSGRIRSFPCQVSIGAPRILFGF
jgi:hypothetical protein